MTMMTQVSRNADARQARSLAGIWAAIHTPFRADFALDEKGIRKNLQHFRHALRLDGIFCNGLMGEYWSLTLAERKRIHELITEEAAPDMGVCPLVNHHSLAETIDLARHAAQTGCDFVALLNPPLGPRADEAVYRFCRQVCDAVRIPVVLFNTPASGYCMSPQLIARIVKGGNVAALKTTVSETANAAIRAHCRQVIVSDPHEARWLRNMRKHGQPVLFADPEPYLFQTASHKPIVAYTAAFHSGDSRLASRLSRSLSPIRAIYAEWIERPLQDGRMPNAALKVWSSLIGLAAGAVRPPLVDLPPKQKLLLEEALLAHLSRGVDNHTLC